MKCKDCKYWSFFGENLGTCETIELQYHSKYPAYLQVDVHDDSGLEASLVTHEDFGCVLFKEKENG